MIDLDPKTKEEIIARYIDSVEGRRKIAAVMTESIRNRRYGPVDPPDRCPHDGDLCVHKCEDACRRYLDGKIEAPRPGYPIDSGEYFRMKLVKQVIDS